MNRTSKSIQVIRDGSSPAERLLRYDELKTTHELNPEISRDLRRAYVNAIYLYLGGNETIHSSFIG